MILKRIEAENVLKYKRLSITNIPATGQIAVYGANESGKTGIGETICLGLFGRTFSVGPEELGHVIRWGEYHGRVTLEFTGSDGDDYVVVRDLDNTGKHSAALYVSGEDQAIAEGREAVADAVKELGGFTYKSFIDSFYLAQREMEVPHGKSDTVKALIGVDKLEAVAGELSKEVAEFASAIRALDSEISRGRNKIADANLDRAKLGRLEAELDTKLAAATAAESESVELSTRAEAIARAAEGVTQASRRFVECTTQTTYGTWRDRSKTVSASLAVAVKASKASGLEAEGKVIEATGVAVKPFEHGLTGYDRVRNLASLYRHRLAHLLDERVPTGSEEEGMVVSTPSPSDREQSFGFRRASVLARIDWISGRRRLFLGAAVFATQLAVLTWVGWAMLRGSPDWTLAEFLRTVLPMSESARSTLLLISAMAASGLTAVCITFYLHTRRDMLAEEGKLRGIEKDEVEAHAELELIDAIEAISLPDALEALRGVRNSLLNSAVVSFVESDGSVFVKSDQLTAKLGAIRDQGDQAALGLRQAYKRLTTRVSELRRQASDMREAGARLSESITEERKQWERVETLERAVAGLDSKASQLRRGIEVRERAATLIDGACQRVYARFHPELRRFVGRILPKLTEDRYEHLEINDDLRVRVFSTEKNDFVGLSEISNGTHRQLMLCVRLALSQALIASSSKAAQFLFFDEPFAFFDEQRMKNAIEVLRRISPQITQVWLAAQQFEDPSRFDMVLACEVGSDVLEVSGRRPVEAAATAQHHQS